MFIQTLLNSIWLILMAIIFAALVFNGTVRIVLNNLLLKKKLNYKDEEKDVPQE